MPTAADNPDDNDERAREAFARAFTPSLVRAQQAFAQMNAGQAEQIRRSLVPMTQVQQNWERFVRQTLLPAEEERRRIARQALGRWAQDWQATWTAAQRQNLAAARIAAQAAVDVDTSGLTRLLRDMASWQTLTEQQRAEAAAVVEETYETTPAADVPDDLVTEMEDAVRDFTAGDVEYVPIEVRRHSFTMFIGITVLMTLMTVAFTSDTADAVMIKAIELSAVAGIAMVAAGKAFDRYTGKEDEGVAQQD
ncbi:hypothetical protein ACIP2X_37705 [Streptomyces sp. NPDC089424]|uniref:hypothetical protein n=1 Tax=Streptomyces sp. NPDC089424 TaxID=3365917 RepID=UPI0037F2679C